MSSNKLCKCKTWFWNLLFHLGATLRAAHKVCSTTRAGRHMLARLEDHLGKDEKAEVGLKTTSASDSLHSWHFPSTVASSTYLDGFLPTFGD